MQYQNNKIRVRVSRGPVLRSFCKMGARTGLTLLEMILAMAIMAIVFAVIVPQLRPMLSSWDSKAGAAEALQNGRVLIDHLHRNLSKAVKITSVSSSGVTEGYIVYEDNDGNTCRYDVASSYVEFGLVGDLNDLAGPVTQLQFTCYDVCDLDTPITDVNDVNSIRSVKVQTTLTNPATLGQDRTFTTQVYLRTNASTGGGGGGDPNITKGTPYEFETVVGKMPALAQIDSTHYLCAYEGGNKDEGWATVLTVNTGTWAITAETPLEFDTVQGEDPALVQIDSTHYLCAYCGNGDDGWATVLTVNTGTWEITNETPFEFEVNKGLDFALAQIDSTHYLCAYEGGDKDEGWATVLTVNTGTWAITAETPLEFDTVQGEDPALAQIDSTHYLCAYAGNGDDGWATVLTVNTETWEITNETPYEFDTVAGKTPALAQIDSTHYLLAYSNTNNHGIAVVMTVNTSTWVITKGTPSEYDTTEGLTPALAQIDSTNYLCAYDGGGTGTGWSVILTVDTGTWEITKAASYEYDSALGETPALAQIDSSNYLCAYEGDGSDGWAVVLKPDLGGDGEEVLP